MREILLRHVDAPLGRIDGHVLPEIRQLQTAANLIRKLLALRVAMAEQVENQVSDRIGRTAAVVAQRREGREGSCRI